MYRELVARIGTRIITNLHAEASHAGLAMILSVEKDNPRAQAPYLRLRFVTTGETDNELVMRRAASRPSERGRGTAIP